LRQGACFNEGRKRIARAGQRLHPFPISCDTFMLQEIKGQIPRGDSSPPRYKGGKKMLKRIKKYRPTTEQLIFLILYRHDGRGNTFRLGISVKDIQKELTFETGRERSTQHIRKLLLNLERKGAIEREFSYLYLGHFGNEGQATRYIVKDVAKGFDFLLTDQELQKREEILNTAKDEEPRLPGSFYKRGYKPSKAYIKNYSPFHKALKETPLPPKFPVGDPRNHERYKRNIEILEAKKRELASTLL